MATKPAAKAAAKAKTAKAATPTTVTLKHLAAELAASHEISKKAWMIEALLADPAGWYRENKLELPANLEEPSAASRA